MCPNQTDDEWRETRENRPWEFALAVALEKEIQAKTNLLWKANATF
jgi:hypothetical protein